MNALLVVLVALVVIIDVCNGVALRRVSQVPVTGARNRDLTTVLAQ